LLSSVFQIVVVIHVIILNIKIVKLEKFHVIRGVVSYKSGLIYKILKYYNIIIIIYIYICNNNI
jgi:hypothetical protein